MSQFTSLSGDGNAIKNFAENHRGMFSAQILNDIRNFPKDSIVSMSKINTLNGKIVKLAFKVDCSNCKPVNGKTLLSYAIESEEGYISKITPVFSTKQETISSSSSVENLNNASWGESTSMDE